jgi:preprotein translocase subunit SecE
MNPSSIFTWANAWWLALLASSLILSIWLWVKWGKRTHGFINEVVLELKKCSWPWNPQEKGLKRYKELIDSTVVVAISALLLAAIVTSSDFVLREVIGFLTRLPI